MRYGSSSRIVKAHLRLLCAKSMRCNELRGLVCASKLSKVPRVLEKDLILGRIYVLERPGV